MKPIEHTPEEKEFGKALCDRLGLDPNRVLLGYEMERVNSEQVSITLHVLAVLPIVDLQELNEVAKARALPARTIGGSE